MGVSKNISGEVNRKFEEQEAMKKASTLGLNYIDLGKVVPDMDLLRLISKEIAEKASLFPLDLNGKKLKIAVIDSSKTETIDAVEELTKQGYIVTQLLGSKIGFYELIPAYNSELLQKKVVEEKKHFKEEENLNIKTTISYFSKEKERINSIPAQTALSEIKAAAVKVKASDIHIQPRKDGSILRFRIDGILYDIFQLDAEPTNKLITRIKYEAGMRSNISDMPQDGHIEFTINDRIIDLRVSTIPTPIFESIVIRILDSQRGIKNMDELGLDQEIQEKIKHGFQKNNGMILVTGPTGSGKTTTLYSMLSTLNDPEKKLVTLEDPIEYHLKGVSQSQVNEKKDYNFDTGLQALLRHDPDIILIGEIRTFQTAKLVSEASLTGHLVLSSMHTNSAVETISRLRNLGLENFNIAPTFNIVMAQRLVRRIHPDRMEMVNLPNDLKIKTAIERIKEVYPEKKIPTQIPKGIENDEFSSCYEGRIAICEIFETDEEIQQMILNSESTIQISKYLKEKTDFLTIFENGLIKVLEGQTTLEELYRVTG